MILCRGDGMAKLIFTETKLMQHCLCEPPPASNCWRAGSMMQWWERPRLLIHLSFAHKRERTKWDFVTLAVVLTWITASAFHWRTISPSYSLTDCIGCCQDNGTVFDVIRGKMLQWSCTCEICCQLSKLCIYIHKKICWIGTSLRVTCAVNRSHFLQDLIQPTTKFHHEKIIWKSFFSHQLERDSREMDHEDMMNFGENSPLYWRHRNSKTMMQTAWCTDLTKPVSRMLPFQNQSPAVNAH